MDFAFCIPTNSSKKVKILLKCCFLYFTFTKTASRWEKSFGNFVVCDKAQRMKMFCFESESFGFIIKICDLESNDDETVEWKEQFVSYFWFYLIVYGKFSTWIKSASYAHSFFRFNSQKMFSMTVHDFSQKFLRSNQTDPRLGLTRNRNNVGENRCKLLLRRWYSARVCLLERKRLENSLDDSWTSSSLGERNKMLSVSMGVRTGAIFFRWGKKFQQ